MKIILSTIHTLVELQSKLEEKNMTLYKLKKLLGMIQKSESRKPPERKDNQDKKPISEIIGKIIRYPA